MLKNTALAIAIVSAGASVACASTESPSETDQDSFAISQSANPSKALARFECPRSFSVKIEETEVKPLVSLRGNAAYQAAVGRLTTLSASPLTMELQLSSFTPRACRYASLEGSGDALIFKRSETQFTEDGTEYEEVITRLDLRYPSGDGASTFRSVFEIFTRDDQTPTAIVENDADDRKGVLVTVDRAWRRIGSSVHTFQF